MKTKKISYRKRTLTTVATLLTATLLSNAPAYAGTWVQPQEQTWMYDEDGTYATGWREIDGAWYYFDQDGTMMTGWIRAAEDGLWYDLDEETGAWISRPQLDETAVCKLLKNAADKSGSYQTDNETEVRIAWKNGNTIYASLVEVTGPNSYTTHNEYKVNTRTGAVDANIGKDFNLYD